MPRKPIRPHKIPYEWYIEYRDQAKNDLERYRIDTMFHLGVEKSCQDLSIKDFAEDAVVSLRTVQRWIKRYNELGLEGMTKFDSRPGRKPILNKTIMREKIDPLIMELTSSQDDRVDVKALYSRVLELGIQIKYPTLVNFLNRKGYNVGRRSKEDTDDAGGSESAGTHDSPHDDWRNEVKPIQRGTGFSKSPRSIFRRAFSGVFGHAQSTS